ncbi:MAG: replicative DNA helicase [Sphingobacteriia bacterium]|nr:replicative DNA helicase [Sphingobacteriia bacterium]
MTIQRVMPHNVEAEQIVIGYLLYDNESIYKFGDFLRTDHFYSQLHQRIYEAIISHINRGLFVSPVVLKNSFDKDPGFEDGNCLDYLNKIMTLASPIVNVADYAKIIYDLALRRRLVNIGEDIINSAFDLDYNSSAETHIEAGEQKLFGLATEGSIDKGFIHFKSALAESIRRIESAIQNRNHVTGISTKFNGLDHFLSGLQKSDLLILAGRPSMGKTAFAINLAVNACQFLYENHLKSNSTEKSPAVGFFSLEMSGEQLTTRILSMMSAVNATKLRSGNINEDDFKKLAQANRELSKYPFFIDDTPALSISALRTRARRLKRQHNLGLIIVDYLQLVRPSSSEGQNRVQEISEITQGLKAIAKELDIPVIALSQLSRAVEQREDKRPLLSDLRESGSIEQDADIVLFIFREFYYLQRKKQTDNMEFQQELDKIKDLTEIIIAKQRNGPIGTVTLSFNADTTKFADYVNNTHSSY